MTVMIAKLRAIKEFSLKHLRDVILHALFIEFVSRACSNTTKGQWRTVAKINSQWSERFHIDCRRSVGVRLEIKKIFHGAIAPGQIQMQTFNRRRYLASALQTNNIKMLSRP